MKNTITVAEYLKVNKLFNPLATREDMQGNSGKQMPEPNDKETGEAKIPVNEIIQLLKENPNPADKIIHDWADQKGYETDDVEEAIYQLATVVANLKHIDDPDENFDSEQLKKGIEVEKEHTDNEDIAKGIAKAHLSESKDYYINLAKMEGK